MSLTYIESTKDSIYYPYTFHKVPVEVPILHFIRQSQMSSDTGFLQLKIRNDYSQGVCCMAVFNIKVKKCALFLVIAHFLTFLTTCVLCL